MDSISDIISTFTAEDIKSFRVFINRQKQLQNRKDLALFNLLIEKKHKKPTEIIRLLYNDLNTEAYHGLRKSLLRHIMNFLVLKQFDEDSSSLPAVAGVVGLSRYLFDNKKDALAWKYLRKAETLAANFDYYDQLNGIYMLQIEHAQKDGAVKLNDIVRNYNANKALADQNNRVTIALGIVKQLLTESRLSGQVVDFEQIVNSVLDEYQIRDSFFEKPKLFYQFMSIFRSAVLAGKDYFAFEPFLLKQYELFSSKVTFANKDISYKSGLLYMIAHTVYRNKKFMASLTHLSLLKTCINEGGKALGMQYLNKYIMLSAANNFFMGAHNEAIALLADTLNGKKQNLSSEDVLNIQLNLCFYYLFIQQYSKANQTLHSILFSNVRCEKLMGKEWVLKKDMVEVIIQFELGNDEIAINRIRYIKKEYEQFMKQAPYERVIIFINLIAEMVDDPKIALTNEFAQKVEASFSWLPVEQEDIQAVMFYAWMKAKLQGRTSYQMLLELMSQAN